MTIFKNTAMPPLSKKRYCDLMNYKWRESGRSLVEMLGAFAIMGILSMAGIWAYNTAMDKLKANTIINEAQKRAVVIAGQIGLMGSIHPTLGEFKENTFGGGTFSTNVTTEGLYKQFGIQVSGVSKRICQNILNSIDDGTPIRRLTHAGDPKSSIGSCTDNNNLLLVYNNDMSTSGGDTAYAEDTCGCQTVCGVCVMEGGVSTCKGECPATGTCSATQPCSGECIGCVIPEGETTGTCQTCQRIAYLESTGTQYIDTGIFPSVDLSFDAMFQNNGQGSGNGNVFGARYASGQREYQLSRYGGGMVGIGTRTYLRNMGSGLQHVSFDGHTTVTVNGDAREIVIGDFGTYKGTIVLFGIRNGQNITQLQAGKIYRVKFGTVRDFVPVYAPFQPTDKQNCMYDRVSKTLFCNQGSGDDFTIPNG